MANVNITKVENNKPARALEELENTCEKIRNRAFEFFANRGGLPGHEIEDWVNAENELFWIPQAKMAETDSAFTMHVETPGFAAKDLQLTAQPGELLIRGNVEKSSAKTENGVSLSEFGEKSLYRCFQFSTPIDVNRVTAHIEHGMLTVVAPKKVAEMKMETAA